MSKSIEYKIGFKTAVIYVIVVLGVVAVIVYLNNLRQDISSQRLEIEKQHAILLTTNDLMYAVGDAQSWSTLYLSTKNRNYLKNYTQSIDVIENLIDEITKLKPNEKEKLHKIATLLREQAQSIKKLNIQFAEKNPVELINERLQDYEPYFKEDTLYISNIQRDTIITEMVRRGFFRRIGDVFRPSKSRDSIRVIEKQWTDTITRAVGDTLAILYEVGDIAQEVQKTYEQNIKTIEKQVSKLMASDKDIASEVSAMLLEFHQETLDATLSIIDNSEEGIERNYIYSTVGGIVALVLILIFIALIITDINKGRAARQALEKANERTRQIMESRHKLLLSVSHDIKSPLNSVLGYLALMESDANVRSMQNSSEHILAMLENLLEFSNLEQGTLQKSLSNFNLLDLFSDIYDMFVPLAGQKPLALAFMADNVRIQTDRVKLKQIVINLVSNAVKYTPSGTVEFTATIRGNYLKIKIKDTGVGIPSEKLPQLFLPFSRIEENNAVAGGTGLGMFVVKGLLDLLDGRININSKIRKGTTITLTIPVERSLKEIPQGVKRIKVYDDEPVVVKLVSDMLLRLGHKVVDADYDLILTDMEMGTVSGLDILHEAADAVPVVLMTGHADFSTQKAIELGFDGFLAKPISMESLREMVGNGETLEDFLGEDSEEIRRIFLISVEENFSLLRQALADNDFKQAQAVCHKMFPMFAQMGYPAEELRKIDARRNHAYEGWREDVEKILGLIPEIP
ncbi:MAG: ATP-binding protein [Lentimicrobiaceae bacterium]|nr:ATP-binding protein [Lentimicrobiaceae bacterium]